MTILESPIRVTLIGESSRTLVWGSYWPLAKSHNKGHTDPLKRVIWLSLGKNGCAALFFYVKLGLGLSRRVKQGLLHLTLLLTLQRLCVRVIKIFRCFWKGIRLSCLNTSVNQKFCLPRFFVFEYFGRNNNREQSPSNYDQSTQTTKVTESFSKNISTRHCNRQQTIRNIVKLTTVDTIYG